MTEDTKEFVELIRSMRNAQRIYFKERTSSTLQRAKFLEHLVDAWISKYDRRVRELGLNLKFWSDEEVEKSR